MECIRCEKPLAINQVGRKRKYCSSYCRNTFNRDQHPELVMAWVATSQQRQREKTQQKYAELPTRKCAICKSAIDPASVNRGAEVCSRPCRIKRDSAKRTPEQIRASKQRQDANKRKESAQKTKAQRLGRYRKAVDRAEIFKRDSYTCQLCQLPLEMTATIPRHQKSECCESWCYLAPTIDHITPLANGGWHEPRNVQAAHFICNSKKSNKSETLTT